MVMVMVICNSPVQYKQVTRQLASGVCTQAIERHLVQQNVLTTRSVPFHVKDNLIFARMNLQEADIDVRLSICSTYGFLLT